MKESILILLSLTILGCSAAKHSAIVEAKTNVDFEIIEIPIISGSDTAYINELQFYSIQSALDGMKLMFENYGKWDEKIPGKHQNNIHRLIWQDIKLLEDSPDTFTVVADGTETETNYWACLMVFDSEGRDCFKKDHPLKNKLSGILVDKMKNISSNLSVYGKFR